MSSTEVRSRRVPIVGVLLLVAAAIFAYLGVLGIVELERGHDLTSESDWPGAAKASPAWFFAALPTWFVGMVATFGIEPSRGRRGGYRHGSFGGHSGSSFDDSSCGSSGGSTSSCGSSSSGSD